MPEQDNKNDETCDDDKASEKNDHINDNWFWIRGSDGKASVTTTFVTIAFVVTTFAYVASIFEQIGPIGIRAFDVGACSSYFVPIMTLYFGRRWTDARYRKGR